MKIKTKFANYFSIH